MYAWEWLGWRGRGSSTPGLRERIAAHLRIFWFSRDGFWGRM